MEILVLIIGILIFGFGIIITIGILFLGDYTDLFAGIIPILLGILLILYSDNITHSKKYGDVIETHYKIEPKIKVVEYTQPYTNIKYKDTVFVYIRKY